MEDKLYTVVLMNDRDDTIGLEYFKPQVKKGAQFEIEMYHFEDKYISFTTHYLEVISDNAEWVYLPKDRIKYDAYGYWQVMAKEIETATHLDTSFPYASVAYKGETV